MNDKLIHDIVQQENPNYKLSLGTRLYVDRFIQPRQRFQAIIKTFYYSGNFSHFKSKGKSGSNWSNLLAIDVESVDFNKPDQTAAIINAWCANATKNHIQDIVTRDDIAQSVILLLNTIYFNGLWRRPFPENQTAALDFYLKPNQPIKIPFMQNTADYHYFESTELNAKILRLPYKVHVSFDQ